MKNENQSTFCASMRRGFLSFRFGLVWFVGFFWVCFFGFLWFVFFFNRGRKQEERIKWGKG